MFTGESLWKRWRAGGSNELSPELELARYIAHICFLQKVTSEELTMQKVMEIGCTMPPALKLVDQIGWDGYWPPHKRLEIFDNVHTTLAFLEKKVVMCGELLFAEKGKLCPHGEPLPCIECQHEKTPELRSWKAR